MPGGPLHAQAGDVGGHDGGLGRPGNGKNLPRNRGGVLHAGVTNPARVDVQSPGQPIHGLEGADADFLDFAINVLAGSGWLVEGKLLDEEILGALLGDASDAGNVAGGVGEFGHGRRGDW